MFNLYSDKIKTLLVLLFLLHTVIGQIKPSQPPEFVNFVNYRNVYSQQPGACITAKNKKPIVGLLLNDAKNTICDSYNIGFTKIQLPGNTIPMCSLDPNWTISNLPGYYAVSNYWYDVSPADMEEGVASCRQDLNKLDSKQAVKEMYGIDAKKAFCERHVQFEKAIFGSTPEVKAIKAQLLDTLKKDFPNDKNVEIKARYAVTATCVGTNKDGCVFMWEHLLKEKDNCILNTLGYNNAGTPTTWLYADGLDLQLAHIWGKVNGLHLTQTKEKNIPYYHFSATPGKYEQSFWAPGLIGGKKPNEYLFLY